MTVVNALLHPTEIIHEYKKLFPAENAEVKMAALMMDGRTLIPARLIAMT